MRRCEGMADERRIHIEVCFYKADTTNLYTVNSNMHLIRTFKFFNCYRAHACKMGKGTMYAVNVQNSFFFAKAAAVLTLNVYSTCVIWISTYFEGTL